MSWKVNQVLEIYLRENEYDDKQIKVKFNGQSGRVTNKECPRTMSGERVVNK